MTIRSDMMPLFATFGWAVQQAQLLEEALRILFKLALQERARAAGPTIREHLDAPRGHEAIGSLLRNQFRKIVKIESSDVEKIGAALQSRNMLVHEYFSGKRSEACMHPAGRAWLVKDLESIRAELREATRVVHEIIDRYLAAYGTSLDKLTSNFDRDFIAGQEPPPDVLH